MVLGLYRSTIAKFDFKLEMVLELPIFYFAYIFYLEIKCKIEK